MSTIIQMVEWIKLSPDPARIRRTFSAGLLTRLATSLSSVGMQEPILARWHGGQLLIQKGERRWRAAYLAGMTRVPVIIEEGTVTPAEALHRQIASHLHREYLKPCEMAMGIARLMTRTGWTTSEAVERLGITCSAVLHELEMLMAPPQEGGGESRRSDQVRLRKLQTAPRRAPSSGRNP